MLSKILKPYFLKNCLCIINKYHKLRVVGLLQNERQDDYGFGQFFIHRIFGYRGVILKLWQAKLYAKDAFEDTVEKYYQVLIDFEDLQFCNLLKSGITYLSESKSKNISIIPEMDYVSQSDILPISKINNSLFIDYFNRHGDSNFVNCESLSQWINTNKSLEITSIHREITENVIVTVIPFYLGEVIENKEIVKFWRYIVRIENMSNRNITLRKRILKLLSLNGNLETIFGKGVDGLPIIMKVNSTLQYHSHVQLSSPPGHMWGTYLFEEGNGQIFNVKIPTFPLCCKYNSNADLVKIL